MRGVLLGRVVLSVVGGSAWSLTWGAGRGPWHQSAQKKAVIERRRYTYDGWECAYRYCRGESKELPAVVLVHPIGIGMSSWFYEPLVSSLQSELAGRAPEVFAPDLIGCGESQPWLPSDRGLFLPLDYVRQIEELWRQEIRRPCVVVVQGGLAPVGISLAARQAENWNGPRAVERLVLCSPPSWQSTAEGEDRDAVAKSYERWSSRLGEFGYQVLRRRASVRFFSNLFLFDNKADDDWLDNCCREATFPQAQHPVFAFNAGVVNSRGLYDELAGFEQPLLLLEGDADRRAKTRDQFLTSVPDCRRASLPNTLNVLPWEDPQGVAASIARFCGVVPASDSSDAS